MEETKRLTIPEGYEFDRVEGGTCSECSFRKIDCSISNIGDCTDKRTDGVKVTFKKLEKVGEPIRLYNDIDSLFQTYKLFVDVVIPKDFGRNYSMFPDNSYIKIELKQNQEDMEEKKLTINDKLNCLCQRYNIPHNLRYDFISEMKELLNRVRINCHSWKNHQQRY